MKNRGCLFRPRAGHSVCLDGESGFALLTALMLLLILTVLGMAAVTVTSFENNMAGVANMTESATSAAESCLGAGVNVIKQTIDNGSVPTTVLSSATPPGPVPASNATVLNQEIIGASDNNTDFPDGTGAVPNLVQTVGPYTVNGDIDRLYLKGKPGSSALQNAAYDGTGNSIVGSAEVYYRLTCVSRHAATGTTARVSAVFACTVTGETCQR